MIDEKILNIYFSRGLIVGIGSSNGQVCMEAAIALASGESLTDRPSCVSPVDRAFWIHINDTLWSSPEARAEALRPAVIPQLGTAGTDRGPWVRALALGMICEILPLALQAAASVAPDEYADPLRDAAGRYAAVTSVTDLAKAENVCNETVQALTALTTALRPATALWAVQTAEEAAQTSMLWAVRATEEAARAVNVTRVEIDTEAEAAWGVARGMRAVAEATWAAAHAAAAVTSKTTHDEMLQAAVQVGLHAYEQTS